MTQVCKYLLESLLSILLDIYPDAGPAGSYSRSSLNLLKNYHTVFYSLLGF